MNWLLWLLLLIFLLWFIARFYKFFLLYFNPELKNTNTPRDLFSLGDNFSQNVALGKTLTPTRKVVIAGLVRDSEKTISNNLEKVLKVGKLFADYRVLIVENDSVDHTREILLDHTKSNPKIEILGCGVNAKECKLGYAPTSGHSIYHNRIQKMVDLRNLYLERVYTKYTSQEGWYYLIVVDMDQDSIVYEDGILASLGKMERMNTVVNCANGIYRWPIVDYFYDTYATLLPQQKFHISEKWYHDIDQGLLVPLYTTNDTLEVDSCFSGFSIYKISALGNVKYDMSPDDSLECEHTRLNTKIKGKKIIDSNLINLVLSND